MKTHNTTTTPRDRVIAAIVNAADAPAARRAIGELVILEPDASIRVRISRLGADVGRKLDHMNHVQFIDHRGALALSRGEEAREALEAFGLEEPWGAAPRIVWDPIAGTGRPRTSDRRSPADEALSDLIAEKVLAGMPRPGVPTFTVNVAPLAAAEVERAVAAALEKALPEKSRREAAAETPKDGPLGRKAREDLQREQGVTFKREDLDALHRLLAQFSAPVRDAQRIALLNAWPTLSHALEGLGDAYKRAAK